MICQRCLRRQILNPSPASPLSLQGCQPMQLVDHDTFFKRLTALFDSSKNQGSIWITHKRHVAMKVEVGAEDSRSYPCLMRVSDGDKVKFSTTVNSTELPHFHQVYGALLKSSMTTLRKRDKKREKQRAEDAAARKKKLSEPVIVAGPKRGNGRRKRQRRIKAALKQQETLAKIKSKEDAKARMKLTTGAPCQFTISSQFKDRVTSLLSLSIPESCSESDGFSNRRCMLRESST
ncbi:signal recognition particle, SRP9/SRP14 subunit [Lentinula raphanica]|nr:signal recognition particle, SRP9/SRP14 subunit [Lentinula raphanica]